MEGIVAEHLTSMGVPFEQQVRVGVIYLVDFRVGDTYIEVNGCYWHGCAQHFPELTDQQRRRIKRDEHLSRYLAKRNRPLIVIWEHDIKHGDFSALDHLY